MHLANSGAICARPETWADMVRPGAILYGYHQRFDPPERRSEVMAEMPLEPSLSLRARIISLRDVPPGEAVGYSARFITERPSKIAVINAGYADGVVRARTNRGCALVHERRVPLVGTISMDLTMLDVTDVPGVGARRRGDDLRQGWKSGDRSFGCRAGDWHGDVGSAVRAGAARAEVLRLSRSGAALHGEASRGREITPLRSG